MTPPEKLTQLIDGRKYSLQVFRNQNLPAEFPRLLIPAYLPNRTASEILAVCIQSIQKFTQTPYELWVTDNNSPRQYAAWLSQQPGINLIINQTTPIPPGISFIRYWLSGKNQYRWGSYANAIGLEIALRFISPDTSRIMTLHMDTLACHNNWLPFLATKLGEHVRAAGYRLERHRHPEGVLHVLGCLADYQLFKSLKLDFFPQLPQIDVGDKITLAFRQAGYQVFACADKEEQIQSAHRMPQLFQNIRIDRYLDDQDNLIFLHLGRGVRKSIGKHTTGFAPSDWITLAKIQGFASGR